MPHDEPSVSVIIPTFNRAHLVGSAIQSVLGQTYQDFEIIVVDDGSTDNTREVVRAFTDPRVIYVPRPNGDLSAARNTGIRASRGEYIAFLDDDDLYLPNKLAVQVRFMDQNPEVGWTSGGYRMTDMQGKPLREYRPWLNSPSLDVRAWLLGYPLTCPTAVMIRREWLGRVGGFDEQNPQTGDTDLWLRLAYAGCHMAWVESVVCCYRMHEANMMRDGIRMKQGRLALLDKFFADPDLPAELEALRNQAYARAYLSGACREYGAAQTQEAKSDLARAIQIDPHLLDDRGMQILEMLVSEAGFPLTADPFAYIKTAFNNLPASAGELHRRRRVAIGQVAMAQLFYAHGKRDWHTVRRMLLIATSNDPSWLRNRGVISISLEALLGSQVMSCIRLLSRRLQNLRRAF